MFTHSGGEKGDASNPGDPSEQHMNSINPGDQGEKMPDKEEEHGRVSSTDLEVREVVKADKFRDHAKENLSKLGLIIQAEDECAPSEEDSASFLQHIDNLKVKNEESKLLGIIDTIINMTKEGKICNQDINQKIPDSIVVLHHENDTATEYICAQVTKKWIQYKFQMDDSTKFMVEMKTPYLVQITDLDDSTCDVLGLIIRHSSGFNRNRIIPEYVVKNEKLSPPGPSAVGDYSSFKGSVSTKKRTATTPQPNIHSKKVSKNYFPKNFTLS